VAGERRFRASLLADQVTIPAVIRDVDDADILKLQIIENVQREGVPFMEEAYAVKKLRDDCTLDVAEIAKIIGKSDAYVYMMLKLCAMPDEARTIAEKGWISKSVAWEISKLTSPEYQTEAANALARTNSSKLITQSGAKTYIQTNILGNNNDAMRKRRVSEYGSGSDYAANWKYHLVRFTANQFDQFKTVVRGRTENSVLSEAVDLVMRGDAPAKNLIKDLEDE
jgi:ParB-like chromosome segregation protein Spo0J